jgi:hypothetical protein
MPATELDLVTEIPISIMNNQWNNYYAYGQSAYTLQGQAPYAYAAAACVTTSSSNETYDEESSDDDTICHGKDMDGSLDQSRGHRRHRIW